MPMQVYVDESGGPGSGRHFVLVALIGHAVDWAAFSDEWKMALNESPAITHFKMREAAGLNGQFHGFSEEERDNKLRRLARIINRYVKIMTYSMIDMDAHAHTWAKLPKPMSEVYFWPFQNSILASCFALWDAGWREKFEIVFDEQVIFGPRAKMWYPAVRALCQHREPDAATILPVDPVFRNDDEFLPIQAADLFAWCLRKATNDNSFVSFEWLLQEMPNVQGTDYSQYYDLERMIAVMAETTRQLKEGIGNLVPANFIDICREIPSQKIKRH